MKYRFLISLTLTSFLVFSCFNDENAWVYKIPSGRAVSATEVFGKGYSSIYIFPENTDIPAIRKIFPKIDEKKIDSFGLVIVLTKITGENETHYINTYKSEHIYMSVEPNLLNHNNDLSHIFFLRIDAPELSLTILYK